MPQSRFWSNLDENSLNPTAELRFSHVAVPLSTISLIPEGLPPLTSSQHPQIMKFDGRTESDNSVGLFISGATPSVCMAVDGMVRIFKFSDEGAVFAFTEFKSESCAQVA